MDEPFARSLVALAARNQSFNFAVSSTNDGLPTDEPDQFLHYDVTNDKGTLSDPVSHQQPETIPLSERSVVVAVWSDDDEYRLLTSGIFRDEYR